MTLSLRKMLIVYRFVDLRSRLLSTSPVALKHSRTALKNLCKTTLHGSHKQYGTTRRRVCVF